MDKTTALKLAKNYAEIIKEEFSPMAVVVYGSYVNGDYDENSDIDVAIIFDGFKGDVLETSAKLYRYTCEVSTIIEPVLLDISKDKSGFASQILLTGEKVA